MSMFGLGQQKPRHYREMMKVAWDNRDELPYAWRILRDGVCDGCALGTSGLKDWTIPGTHLCMVRLELMRLNTAPALDGWLEQLHDNGRSRVIVDAAGVASMSSDGVAVLAEHAARFRVGGGGLRVRNASRVAHQVLELCGARHLVGDGPAH